MWRNDGDYTQIVVKTYHVMRILCERKDERPCCRSAHAETACCQGRRAEARGKETAQQGLEIANVAKRRSDKLQRAVGRLKRERMNIAS